MKSRNFEFLRERHRELADLGGFAEAYVHSDPTSCLVKLRTFAEFLVKALFSHHRLELTYQSNLNDLLADHSFKSITPPVVQDKLHLIRIKGNHAAHGTLHPTTPVQMTGILKEAFDLAQWFALSTGLMRREELPSWQEPLALTGDSKSLLQREKKAALQKLAEQEALMAKLLADLEEARAQAEAAHTTTAEKAALLNRAQQAASALDFSEEETRFKLIDELLAKAGWKIGPRGQNTDEVTQEHPVLHQPVPSGKGRADYVVWDPDNGLPLGVIESKKTAEDAAKGKMQSKYYADGLEKEYGQRPVIFYTNGYEIFIWDDAAYPPRRVSGFYKKEELARLILRRSTKKPFKSVPINGVIVERYYAKRSITSICEHFSKKQRKALLVMATGTGKTRVAIALVDVLQRAGWAKRVLFLADRVSLVNQAGNAFKAHLTDSSPVNLVTEKNTEGRVYVCTYPTMMGLIDVTDGGTARFGVGHFDLIIIDEAHRSVYQRYREIFRYFDCLLVGLTATPREQVDKNTYELFDLEEGVPTDAYELELAVSDGYLVPPQVRQVDLKFPRDGIHYDDLSDAEKEEWESLDWGDNNGNGGAPDTVQASAINSWLFNTDTVDKMLQHLMKEGLKVEGGDRLGKTIIFARNHDHAVFIEERFNFHYPHHAGHFARIIDHQAKYPQSLIDDFSQKDKAPHIAISVDMLDTGIDVPEIVNLVFFKPVYSKIKFWQMIGRGTRLCKNLFGPDQHKEHFRIFDFCFNFDFFRENPNGIEGSGGEALGTRLFKSRVQLLAAVQRTTELEPSGALRSTLASTLHGEVSGMNPDNFMVRAHLKHVERFKNAASWESLTDSDIHDVEFHVAGLPSQIETDGIEARFFDLSALRMQIALIENDAGAFESTRKKVIEIAACLEEKDAIPAVKQQLEYLRAIQTTEFWEGIDIAALEDLRLRLRGLVQFIDKSKRKIVYTRFEDEIIGVRVDDVIIMPKMTGHQYAKKVEDYLRSHQNEIAIQRLRNNQPLTPTDLQSLENTLLSLGEDEGERLLTSMLQIQEMPTLAHLVRRIVGMDRSAAKAAFASFLTDRSLNAPQMRFVELVIDQLTARGFMEASALYEQPFSSLHADGPEGLFVGKPNIIDGLFHKLEETLPRMVEA